MLTVTRLHARACLSAFFLSIRPGCARSIQDSLKVLRKTRKLLMANVYHDKLQSVLYSNQYDI